MSAMAALLGARHPEEGSAMFPRYEVKDLLRRHAVFLDDSVLSNKISRDPVAQIDAILSEELPLFIAEQKINTGGRPVPVMFWSHGGNVLRRNAIREVVDYTPKWLANGIYPIYFLWDTAPGATVWDAIKEWFTPSPAGQILEPLPRKPPWRNLVLGAGARLVNVPDIWTEMKEAASNSNAPIVGTCQGGAYLFAQRLAARWSVLGQHVELHAVGHSAGAIFHADFIPLLYQNGITGLESLQFLAPAIRIEEYSQFVKKMRANSWNIRDTRMFTMKQDAEEQDTVFWLYRGSLLYFIRDVLEYGKARERELLGLKVDFDRADPMVTGSFNDVIFTPTAGAGGLGGKSDASSHTAFSKDPETLNSIATNILGTYPWSPF
ncbi:hypothetical protein ACSVHC_00025 [Arthrobacter sp. KNU-44]|uniref:hypothetical protein n=1 Tax=Arthrobacter sp. KNU-44 TaxID=3450744 RepID=UPI003F43F38C